MWISKKNERNEMKDILLRPKNQLTARRVPKLPTEEDLEHDDLAYQLYFEEVLALAEWCQGQVKKIGRNIKFHPEHFHDPDEYYIVLNGNSHENALGGDYIVKSRSGCKDIFYRLTPENLEISYEIINQ